MSEIDLENARRIIDQTKTTNISPGDSFAIDSATGGTRRIEYSDLANQLKGTLNIDSIAQTANGAMQKSVYDVDGDGIVDNAEKVNNHSVDSDVPANAVFTDTTYNPVTPGGAAGLMSGADKSKLDGIETGANHTDVDDTLNASSTNPVQNGTIVQALGQKQNTLQWDTTPTSGSANPVTSGGLYTLLSVVASEATALSIKTTETALSTSIMALLNRIFGAYPTSEVGDLIVQDLVDGNILLAQLAKNIKESGVF